MKRIALLSCIVALLQTAALAAEPPGLPVAAKRPVDFHKDIFAILANSCAKCHAGGKSEGEFSIDTREALLKGGASGPAVVVGKSGESRLIELVAGIDEDNVMPAQGPRLTAEQVGLLRAWIDQGLPWEAGFTFQRRAAAPIEPRRVAVPDAPEGSGLTNPIDRLLAGYYAAAKVQPGELVDDRTFLRRASLDIVGLMPSPEAADAFQADQAPDKRAKVTRQLLDERAQYALHWLTFWNDALRNDYRGTGYIDGGRLQITEWLARSLYENVPYDRFVRELINPTPESAGFVKGIVWRGVVNASQVPPVQAAQNISQVFLGINLKCASCHDSFISDWKLTQAYALANVFADEPLEIHRCDQPTGQFAGTQFLYPQLGSIDASAPKPERLRQLSEIMTRAENGRLSRTIVNRLWARLLGRGLIEPVDEMDNPPWSADLLDFLATDLVDHGYDLKHTIELIVTSRAYQTQAVPSAEPSGEEFVFRGPVVRWISAEQFVDAVSSLARVEYAGAAAKPAVLKQADEKSKQSLGQLVGERAALVNADPLLTALGRSNREQVVTERPQTATTLQALELTNGTPLSALLAKGAGKWSEEKTKPAEVVEAIYRQALLRLPTEEERALALELIGEKVTPEGVEDLLWAVVMLPEFQLIY